MTHPLIHAAPIAATVGAGPSLAPGDAARPGTLPVMARVSGPNGGTSTWRHAPSHPVMPATFPTVRVVLPATYPVR